MEQIQLFSNELLPMQEIFSRENVHTAWKQVRQNGGSAGVDGVSAKELPLFPETYWDNLKSVPIGMLSGVRGA